MPTSICDHCNLFIPTGSIHNCSMAPPPKVPELALRDPKPGEVEYLITEAEITQPDRSRWLFRRIIYV